MGEFLVVGKDLQIAILLQVKWYGGFSQREH